MCEPFTFCVLRSELHAKYVLTLHTETLASLRLQDGATKWYDYAPEDHLATHLPTTTIMVVSRGIRSKAVVCVSGNCMEGSLVS